MWHARACRIPYLDLLLLGRLQHLLDLAQIAVRIQFVVVLAQAPDLRLGQADLFEVLIGGELEVHDEQNFQLVPVAFGGGEETK